MNHEKEHKQEALGEYKIIHPSLHLSTPMLYSPFIAYIGCGQIYYYYTTLWKHIMLKKDVGMDV